MTTRTQADLVAKILEKLMIVPEGQAPEADDIARVETNLPSVIEELAAREIVYVPDLSNIPGAWFLSLAKVCAYEMRDEFGISGESLAQVTQANTEGILNLKQMTRGRPTYEPLKTLSY